MWTKAAASETCIRGDPFNTFVPRGGRGVQKLPKFANESADRLREMRTKGRDCRGERTEEGGT